MHDFTSIPKHAQYIKKCNVQTAVYKPNRILKNKSMGKSYPEHQSAEGWTLRSAKRMPRQNLTQIQLKAYHINANAPYFALSVSRSKNILAGFDDVHKK
jgi:hypothetical protein